MITVVRDIELLRRLKPSWDALARSVASPLLQHEWFVACAEAQGPAANLWVVLRGTPAEFSAVAPCVRIRENGGDRIELLGSSFLSEPTGLLYESKEALDEVLQYLAVQGTPLLLSRLKGDSLESLRIPAICGKDMFLKFRSESTSPWLPIETSWEIFEQQLPSKRRWTLRRAQRRAEALGPVQFRMIAPDETNVTSYLEEFMRVEESGWKGRQGSCLRLHKSLRTFFTSYATMTAANHSLRIAFLRIGDQCASALLGVQFANRFWVLKTGYDEAFSACSPGILVTHESIHEAFERAMAGFEFLGSDEPWIHTWTERVHRYLTYRMYPLSAHSLWNLGVEGGSFIVRRALSSKDVRTT